MRISFISKILLIFLAISCSRMSQSGETAWTMKKSNSRWVIPLERPASELASLALIIPIDGAINIFGGDSGPDEGNIVLTVTDTTQARILRAASFPGVRPCEADEFIEVELPNKTRGWLWSGHARVVDNPNLGTYTFGDLSLTAASMRRYFREEQGDCSWIRPLFFYDSAFIYLIDVTNTDAQQGEMFWDKDQYLSVVQHPVDPEISGATEGEEFVMKWGVPNAQVVLKCAFQENHIRYTYYQMTGLDSDVGDLEGDEGEGEGVGDVTDGADDEQMTVTCTLSEVSMGDCYHIIFDECGDFGNASTMLSKEEMKLWDELAINNGGKVSMNPKYEGKTFEITFTMQKGDPCKDPSGPADADSKVPVIMAFSLVGGNQ